MGNNIREIRKDDIVLFHPFDTREFPATTAWPRLTPYLNKAMLKMANAFGTPPVVAKGTNTNSIQI